nr:MAG TPA: hypothetical protein [Caudoviricetes sp.]
MSLILYVIDYHLYTLSIRSSCSRNDVGFFVRVNFFLPSLFGSYPPSIDWGGKFYYNLHEKSGGRRLPPDLCPKKKEDKPVTYYLTTINYIM